MQPIITTYTGRNICPLDLKVEDVNIVDIVQSLSMQVRFGGHIKKFYSNCEHSCHVHDLSLKITQDKRLHMACLMHDFCESITGVDFLKPCKTNFAVAVPPHGEIITIGELEDRISKVISKALGFGDLDFNHKLVKYCDKVILNTESAIIRGFRLFDDYPIANIPIKYWEPEHAYDELMWRYSKLKYDLNV